MLDLFANPGIWHFVLGAALPLAVVLIASWVARGDHKCEPYCAIHGIGVDDE